MPNEYKTRDAAEAIGISTATLRRDIKSGKVEYHKYSDKVIRISELALKKYKLSCRRGCDKITIEDIKLFEECYAPVEVDRVLKISIGVVRKKLKNLEITHYIYGGGTIRIYESDLESYKERCRVSEELNEDS